MNNEPFQTQPLQNDDDGQPLQQPAGEPGYNEPTYQPGVGEPSLQAQYQPVEDEPIYSPRYRPPPEPVAPASYNAPYPQPDSAYVDPAGLDGGELPPVDGATAELPVQGGATRRARRMAYLERARRAAAYAGLQTRAFATQVRSGSARAGSAFTRSPVGRYIRDNTMLAVAVGCLLLTVFLVMVSDALNKRGSGAGTGTPVALAGVNRTQTAGARSRGATATGGLATPGVGTGDETVVVGLPSPTIGFGVLTPTTDPLLAPTFEDEICPDGTSPEFTGEPCPIGEEPTFDIPTIFPTLTMFPTFAPGDNTFPPVSPRQTSPSIVQPTTFIPNPSLAPQPTVDTGEPEPDCSEYPPPEECNDTGEPGEELPTEETEETEPTFGPDPTFALPTTGTGSGRTPTTSSGVVSSPTLKPSPAPPTPTSPPPATSTPARPPAVVLNGHSRWTLANSPVILAQDYLIAGDASLAIDPGVEVRLSSGVRFMVNGTLVATGAAGQPVRFVSADGGLWSYISVAPGGRAELLGVELRGAGAENLALYANGGSLVVRDTLLTGSAGRIETESSNVEIRRTFITGNDLRASGSAIALVLGFGNSATLAGNTVSGNTVSEGSTAVKLSVNGRLAGLIVEGNLVVGSSGTNMLVEAAEAYRASFTCNTFSGGAIGLNLRTSQPSLEGFSVSSSQNVFQGHQQRGAAGDLAFDLSNNWWNSPSGPYEGTRNPSGTGDAVGPNLIFKPWLTSRPTCAPQ